jgi:hypothetical protein
VSGWSLAIKLGGLARSVGKFDQPVQAAIESMNGARFVHDRLELAGREVLIGDAQKVNPDSRTAAVQR